MTREQIETQARLLARHNRDSEPEITQVFWFPDDQEVRLVEVHQSVPPSGDEIESFYFRPSPSDQLPAPSRIALIRPDELRHVTLPASWGNWDDAVELQDNGDH